MRGVYTSKRVLKNLVLYATFLLTSSSVSALTPSGPIVITGETGTIIEGLQITNANGDCVRIINSTNVTIRASEIGPCAGQGVYISGGTGNNVLDNYIHVDSAGGTCCDTRDNILIQGSATYITVQGNVLAYAEANVRVDGGAHHITVHGNFMHNPLGPYPRGQNFQSDGVSNLTVTNNYTFACVLSGSGLPGTVCPSSSIYQFSAHQEDSINFYNSTTFLAQGNYVWGGESTAGCGLIADYAGNAGEFRDNIVRDSGQCGIGIAAGTNMIVDGNKILNLWLGVSGGETALYVWDQSPIGAPCGPVQVSNNIADQVRQNGVHSGYWNGGGCEPVTLTNNTFNEAAYTILYPMSSTNPPPAIPPVPHTCVTVSPFTTNTSTSLCGALQAPSSLLFWLWP